MENTLFIATNNSDKTQLSKFIDGLKSAGFNVLEAGKEVNDNDLYFLDLSNTTLSDLEDKYPWLKEELNRSNILHLRILPLLIYDSKKEDPFKKFEEGPSEIYEEVFSEEFKPYAYDVSNPESSNKELEHVLSLYYVR